jgi:hypothetical protein
VRAATPAVRASGGSAGATTRHAPTLVAVATTTTAALSAPLPAPLAPLPRLMARSSLAAVRVGGRLKRQETKIVPGGDSEAGKQLARLDELLMLPEMEQYLSELPGRSQARIHEWNMDIFDFAAKAKGYHLVVGVHQLLDDWGLIQKFRLSKHRLLTFLHRIQDGYIPENPYHNSLHALDVALNTSYFCRQQLIDSMITPLDRLAAIIAACIHDFQHPGLNANFLQATKHEVRAHHAARTPRTMLSAEASR